MRSSGRLRNLSEPSRASGDGEGGDEMEDVDGAIIRWSNEPVLTMRDTLGTEGTQNGMILYS